jgi:3-phenylpropionate/trans-cinnamate dioxygenase ferredoxin reductase subunit
MDRKTFAIVGASLTGAKAAEELRAQGFDGRVLLIGSEPEAPYERPPLTKDYLRGESTRAGTRVHPDGFYEEHGIELVVETTVTALRLAERRLALADGREIGYDKLLLATGAEPRRPDVPGSDLETVHYLRNLRDADVLRERLDRGGHAVVVGGGWIGSEFAASARQRGVQVTLIDPLELPGARVFGEQVAAFYRDVHARHGVELRLGEGVERFELRGGATRVHTSSGAAIDCDFAVVGIGVVPRVELARAAGLAVEDGISVDASLRTSDPDVFAAGDVAGAWHPFYGRRLRVEHWANARGQGPAAARAMLGMQVAYDRIPYFFSDQYDVGMEYSGHSEGAEQLVVRGEISSGEFVALWLRADQVIAGMNVNVWDVNEHVQALIRSRRPVDAAALEDIERPLESLLEDPVPDAAGL